MYHRELALTRRPPCSTFKIISSLIVLDRGAIRPGDSTRIWSGERFWNEKWNQDMDFPNAFRTSCVWYFREVVDELGRDVVQQELERLAYGNCDLSDWEGRSNTNQSSRAQTGFWIESSLLISPKEQAEAMERIFGGRAGYSEEVLDTLKEVMLLPPEENGTEFSVFGKTGMGKDRGVVVDAWFTGFADSPEKRVFFCVYLGEADGGEASSAKAKEIAVRLVSDYLWETC